MALTYKLTGVVNLLRQNTGKTLRPKTISNFRFTKRGSPLWGHSPRRHGNRSRLRVYKCWLSAEKNRVYFCASYLPVGEQEMASVYRVTWLVKYDR